MNTYSQDLLTLCTPMPITTKYNVIHDNDPPKGIKNLNLSYLRKYETKNRNNLGIFRTLFTIRVKKS